MASITLLCSLLALVTLTFAQSYPYQCKSYCDPHIAPFPGGRTDVHQDGVQIPGTFKLATFGIPTVVVYENHYDCGNGVFCNDKAAITVNGHSIVIISDDVYVDGAYVTSSIAPDYTVDSITTIHKLSTGHYIVEIAGVGKIETSLRGEWMNIDIYVTNPPPPGPDGGLCHPRNGDSVCPDKEYSPETLEGFACSYYVPDDENPFIIRTNPTSAPDVPPATPPPKPEDKSWEEYAAELCGPILNNTELRDQCGRYVNVELFYAACYSDVVLSHQLSFSGGAIDAYAATCANLPEGERFVLPTSAISSTATGITSPIRPGSYHFTIQAKDVLRRDITTGGETWVITNNGPSQIQSRVTDNGNGSYDVSYTIRTTGIYSIGVWHRGSDPIANSPFRVVVQ